MELVKISSSINPEEVQGLCVSFLSFCTHHSPLILTAIYPGHITGRYEAVVFLSADEARRFLVLSLTAPLPLFLHDINYDLI